MKKIFLTLICLVCVVAAKSQQKYTIENQSLKATIDLNDGSLIGLDSKITGWNILEKEAYGRSFEADIKLADGSFHVINAKSQSQPEVTILKDEIVFLWNGIKVGSSTVDVIFEGHIKITDKGLVYSGSIDNRSDAIVEQFCWPFIGEISVPEVNDRMLFQYMNYTKFNTNELYPNPSDLGWCNLPEHSFVLIHNGKQGLYLSSVDHQLNEFIRCVYETLPKEEYAANAGGVDSKKNNGESSLMRTQIKAARMLFMQPHTKVTFMPVILTPYKGDWHSGVDIYKKWRETWFVAPHRADWVKRVNSWQQLQINSSESKINFTVKDLNKYVKECKKFGVDAIQLTGWTWGGQDRGLPVHDIDPRLGTFDQLKKAISDAEKVGVKILLFTKFTWVDMTADWYSKWAPHLAWNNQADTCVHPGYNYNTYTQLLGINTRRFGIFCMMDDQLRAGLQKEFQKCLDLGAPGMVYDENQHHAGTYLCFNPNHGHKVPGFVHRGADLLGAEFLAMCKKSNPDFLMVGEGPYDIQSQYYSTYTRADYNHEPVLRYIDPEIPIACAVLDHNDKNNINMCFANRYAMSYEPRNFKGSLSEIPRVMAYGQKVDNLRKRYSDRVWDAEFQHTLGATVSGKDLRYTVFKSNKSGKKSVVVYNVNTNESNVASVKIDGSTSALVVVSPEKQSPVKYAGSVQIAPQSMVVIMEK